MHEALTIKAECSTVAHTSARDLLSNVEGIPWQAANLAAEKRFWGAVSVRVDAIDRRCVAEHSRQRIQIYERS
jgi:hypothetical protein